MSEFAELHDELRSVARDLLGRAADGDDAKTWAQIAEAGWLGLEVPEDLDGAGVTFAETAVVLEELGRAAAPGPFVGTAVLGVGAALAVEPNAGRNELLRSLAAGSSSAAVILAPHANSALASPAFHLDGGTLHGSAELVIDAPRADHVLVLAAAVGRGRVLVRLDVAAAEVETVPVLDESRSIGTVSVDGLAVGDDDVWTFAGDPQAAAQSVLDRAALAMAIDGYGLAHAMLDLTVGYVSERRQFDRAIGSFQAVKHQCADSLVSLRIGRELIDEAVAATAAGAPDAAIATARASSFLGEAAVEIVGVAMQLHGGIGYTWESGIHRYLKRALLDRSIFGSPAAQRRRIGATMRRRIGATMRRQP